VSESGERGLTAAGSDLARGSSALFWAQVLGNAGLFVALVVVTRALGASGRGTFALLTVGAIVLARFARLGVTEATTVFAARSPELRPTLLTNAALATAVSSGLVAAIVCGAIALTPDALPAGLGSTELLLLALATIASAFADTGYAFALGCSRFRLHALTTILTSWLYAAIVALVWAAGGLTFVRAALAWIAVQALKGGVLLGRAALDEGAGRPQGVLLLDSFRFGVRAWLGSLSDMLNDRLDQILVALIASQAVLGVYAVAVNGAEILLYLPGAAATAVLPLVARSGADGPKHVLGAFRSVLLVTIASVAVGAALGPILIPFVFGSAFDASVVPFLLLLPGAFGYAALLVFSNALVASGAPGRSSLGMLGSLVVTVALDLLLIGRYGASGAAAAATAGYLLGGALALTLYRGVAVFSWRALLLPKRRDIVLAHALVEPILSRFNVPEKRRRKLGDVHEG
jgi:O-antigen/teichoic acid export membrane protein